MLSKEERKALERIEDFLTTNIIILISNDDTANSEELKAFISKNEFIAIEYIVSKFLKYSKEIEELKENHKETIAECYYKCSELWQNKIFTKIREIENECKKCRFKGEICKELCQNSQCVQGECLKVLHSLSR